MERFNPKSLSDVEVKEQYLVKIPNKFAVLENLDDDDDLDISRAWESIRIFKIFTHSLGSYELNQH
jgi:hypothetical protein